MVLPRSDGIHGLTLIDFDRDAFLKLVKQHYPGGFDQQTRMPKSGFVYVMRDDIREWAKENDIAIRPDMRYVTTVDRGDETMSAFQYAIVVPDEVSAVLFKLRWCGTLRGD